MKADITRMTGRRTQEGVRTLRGHPPHSARQALVPSRSRRPTLDSWLEYPAGREVDQTEPLGVMHIHAIPVGGYELGIGALVRVALPGDNTLKPFSLSAAFLSRKIIRD
jgi:hypothetical protein